MSNYGTNSREIIRFSKRLAPGETVTLQERIKAACTVETVKVRFYRGQELALRVNPYIEHKGQRYENIVTYPEGTDRFLSGDDDYFIYDSVLTAENDDYFKVWAHNTDPTYSYDVSVDVVVDYFGGKDRVV